MKRCPACSRVYDDAGLRFCLDDGANLVAKAPTDPVPRTLVLPVTPEPEPTIKQAFLPVESPVNDGAPRPDRAEVPRKRNTLAWIVAGVLLVMFSAGIVVGAWVIYNRRVLTWHLTLAVDPSTPDRAAAAKQAAAVIERRLSAFGLPNFRVAPQGDGRIMVDLPNVPDPERVKALIATGGQLELAHVISAGSPAPVQTYATREEAITSLNNNGTIPTNRRVLPYPDRGVEAASAKRWVAVEAPAIINGRELKDATAVPSRPDGLDYQITFSLNQSGADKFGAWTASNINEYLGVVLNDEVKSVAYIKSQIYDQGVIDGRFTKQNAEDLALVLKAGALPAKLEFQEERIDK